MRCRSYAALYKADIAPGAWGTAFKINICHCFHSRYTCNHSECCSFILNKFLFYPVVNSRILSCPTSGMAQIRTNAITATVHVASEFATSHSAPLPTSRFSSTLVDPIYAYLGALEPCFNSLSGGIFGETPILFLVSRSRISYSSVRQERFALSKYPVTEFKRKQLS
jgi:hypothetical protein